jgi:hypothetical protein
METMVMFISMFTPRSIREKAFDSIEGKGFFRASWKDYNARNSVKAFWIECRRLKKEGIFDRLPDNHCIATIYGSGGGNRYHVYKDGSIVFDMYYCHDTRNQRIARASGFKIRERNE